MKKTIVAALACLMMFACSKSHVEDNQLLNGKWELRQSAGGIAGTINYEPGNGYIIEYGSNGQYRYIYPPNVNGIPRFGAYELKPTSRAGDWWLQTQYVYNNQTVTEKDSVRLDAGKLIFLPVQTCCDIATITYEKTGK